jgi:hypothetical protein
LKLISRGEDPGEVRKVEKERIKLEAANTFEAVTRTWLSKTAAKREPISRPQRREARGTGLCLPPRGIITSVQLALNRRLQDLIARGDVAGQRFQGARADEPARDLACTGLGVILEP